MRMLTIAAFMAIGTVVPALAEEGGCLKDGAIGAVAGHMVGSGHAVAGGAAGCALGVHERNKAEDKKVQQAQPADQPQAQQPPKK